MQEVADGLHRLVWYGQRCDCGASKRCIQQIIYGLSFITRTVVVAVSSRLHKLASTLVSQDLPHCTGIYDHCHNRLVDNRRVPPPNEMLQRRIIPHALEN